MANEIPIVRVVPLLEKPENLEWLMEIMKGKDQERRPKPRIQRVATTLSEIEANKACFGPSVVSLGPYYRHEERFQPMKPYKEAAVRWFVSHLRDEQPENATNDMEAAKVNYQKFVGKFTKDSSPIDHYADKFVGENQSDLEDFMRLMFLDGCFILHFIDLVVNRHREQYSNESLIVRDMFLLENQIPYSVLNALMSLLPEEKKPEGKCSSTQRNLMDRFIEMVLDLHAPPQSCLVTVINLFREMFWDDGNGSAHTESKSNPADETNDDEPCHLLDSLRTKIIGKGISEPSNSPATAGNWLSLVSRWLSPLRSRDLPTTLPLPQKSKNETGESGDWKYYFRSVMELKTAGIKLRRSNSKSLNDIQFEGGLLHGYLHLPQLIVDDATKSRLLNLIAYEMCPDSLSDRAVTSYICVLDSLIDHPEDVKELRTNDILLNRLGSDQEVARLFNELANNLTPNSKTYTSVMKDIERHVKNKGKVWIAEFVHTHFTSPWTLMALMAAILVILLTLAQTYYSAGSYYLAMAEGNNNSTVCRNQNCTDWSNHNCTNWRNHKS